MSQLTDLPENLPIPKDDGMCDHLVGCRLPSINLCATDGTKVDFSTLESFVVIYIYPMTGKPDVALPDGWNDIPGARGCTPQSCSFRSHYKELRKFNASVYGLSTQDTDYQAEVVSRLHLPYLLVSDKDRNFINSLSLPVMKVDNMTLAKRVTLIAYEGVIEKVFYPVFPPDKNAEQVITYFENR